MTTSETSSVRRNSMRQIEVVMLLQGVELFKFCSAEEIVRIAAISEQRAFAAGEQIYRAKDPARTLYCVVEGEVALESEGGDDELRLGPHDSFGVLEILSGRLRANHARATKDTLTLAISAGDFFDLLSNNVEIVKALFREVLGERPGSPMV